MRVFGALLLSLLLSSCSGWNALKRIEVKTVEVDRVIPTQNRPRQLDLNNITWFVVTDQKALYKIQWKFFVLFDEC